MRVEFYVNPAEGLSGVLEPVTFLECPTVREGYIRVGGRAALSMGAGEQHTLTLLCDAYTHANAEIFQDIIREATSKGVDCNPRLQGGTYVMDVPIKSLRSQWVSGRLLCYAEVGESTPNSMEIPGVNTVLVLCDRVDRFHWFFRQKNPDRMEGVDAAVFGMTRYLCACSVGTARGFSPTNTRYAVLEPFFQIAEMMERIVPFFERVYLEEENCMTAAGVLEQRERSRHRGFTGARMVRREYVDGILVREVDLRVVRRGAEGGEDDRSHLSIVDRMRVSRIIVDDPIANHDSSEYLEAVARYQQVMTGAIQDVSHAFFGVDRSGQSARRNPYIEEYLRSQGRTRPVSGIGDTSCMNNARDRHLRCAINPMGPCEGCSHFEERES